MGSDNPVAPVTDLVEEYITQPLGDLFDPDYTGTDFNATLAQAPGGVQPKEDPTDPPKVEEARHTAFSEAKSALRRRRLSSTLLTSGTGVMDKPSTTSTVLLGT